MKKLSKNSAKYKAYQKISKILSDNNLLNFEGLHFLMVIVMNHMCAAKISPEMAHMLFMSVTGEYPEMYQKFVEVKDKENERSHD